MMRILAMLLIGLLMLTGCTEVKESVFEQSPGIATAKEILDQNPTADIFN